LAKQLQEKQRVTLAKEEKEARQRQLSTVLRDLQAELADPEWVTWDDPNDVRSSFLIRAVDFTKCDIQYVSTERFIKMRRLAISIPCLYPTGCKYEVDLSLSKFDPAGISVQNQPPSPGWFTIMRSANRFAVRVRELAGAGEQPVVDNAVAFGRRSEMDARRLAEILRRAVSLCRE
jgi:hypothetical protein